MLPEFPEDGYPNVPEMEPLKEVLNNHILSWKQLEQTIMDNVVSTLTVDVSNKTPQELLQRVVETMESKAAITDLSGTWALALVHFRTLRLP
jgi:adenylate/nucleoside-diphosphate kinase